MLTPLLTISALVLFVATSAMAQPAEPRRLTVTAAGAVGDGATLNTRAIQSAIDDLAKSGGGTLVIPAGRFRSGALFLKPAVNLHLENDAVLLGSTNIDDYPPGPTRIEGHSQVWRPALVNADHCDHLQITGPGTIQGGGKPYWDAFWARRKSDKNTKNLDVDRPRNLFIRDSAHVTLSGIRLRESGFWNLHLYRCTHASLENLDIRTPKGAPSTDGIDVDSCQDVTIRSCYISVDDDNIALKGSKGPLADQDTDSPAVERIHIVDCTFASGHGAVTLGSEASHVKDVLVENCKLIDAPDTADAGTGAARNHNILCRLKLRPDTPQHYENLTFRNCTLDCHADLIAVAPWTQYFDLQGHAPPTQLVENVTLEHITGTASAFGRITGPKSSTVRNITLRDITLTLTDPNPTFKGVENLQLQNVTINGAPLSPTQ